MYDVCVCYEIVNETLTHLYLDLFHSLNFLSNYPVQCTNFKTYMPKPRRNCMTLCEDTFMGECTLAMHTYIRLSLPSNQSFYRLIAGYWMGGGDHEVPRG